MCEEDYPPIVLDLGSCTTKVGLASEAEPRATCLTLCADKSESDGSHSITCSDEATRCTEAINFRYPMERGIVRNWDDMQSFCGYAISSAAGLNMEEHSILISEPPLSSKLHKEKFAEMMLETFKMPFVHIAKHDVLSLYSSGRTTGLVLSSGDGVTSITPIQDGFRIENLVRKLNVVGLDLTLRVQEEVNKQGCFFKGAADYAKVREIKENLCHVVTNGSTDHASDEAFLLPDGQEISLGEEAHRIPEVMFTPLDLEATGFPKAVYEAIMKCDVSIRKDLYKNILLCGGNTLFPGFVERMDHDLGRLVPSSICIKTVPHEDKLKAVWLGGAVLASLSTFKSVCISRKEYDEVGPHIVHRKL